MIKTVINGKESYDFSYASQVIRNFILDKKGVDIISLIPPRTKEQLAKFECACTHAFAHFNL